MACSLSKARENIILALSCWWECLILVGMQCSGSDLGDDKSAALDPWDRHVALGSPATLIMGPLGFLHLSGAFPGPLLRPLSAYELGEGGNGRQTLLSNYSESRTRREVRIDARGGCGLQGASWSGTVLCLCTASRSRGTPMNSEESRC